MAPITDSTSSASSATAALGTALVRRDTTGDGSWQGGLTLAGVDLIAMVVSDSGLSSIVPQWWNASPTGCILIGLQPRGGWQVLQRTVQWGEDTCARAFGVNCTKPILYEYFACSIRNRIEVWNSPRWTSPMHGEKEAGRWKPVGKANLARPTKLIDGSRGGQAFVCGLLRPQENSRYAIQNQARVQLLSVMLVAAGFMDLDSVNGVEELQKAMREDFEVSDRLGVVFGRLFPVVVAANVAVIILVIIVFYTIWERNFFGKATPYIIQLCSFLSWAIGATGLLMMGGNPRVRIVSKEIPKFVEDRLRTLTGDEAQGKEESKAGQAEYTGDIEIEFGSLHGSVYKPDYGTCVLPAPVVRSVCAWDLEFSRTRYWYSAVIWFGLMLLCSIVLQIAGIVSATIWSEIMGVVILLVTSIARGLGISGREEWLIPRWKSRANYGAKLQGVLESRNYA